MGRKYFRFQSLECQNFSTESSPAGPGVDNAGSDGGVQSFPFSVKESILLDLFQTPSAKSR